VKTLVLVRHAKSSWDQPLLDDHDRPLAPRGIAAAPLMAQRLARLQIPIEHVACSTSRRTRQTFSLMSEVLCADAKDVLFLPGLYQASSQSLFDYVRRLPDSISHCCIIAHNPGLTQLLENLTGAGITNIPTCGIAVVQSEKDSWSDVVTATVNHYMIPKRSTT
jgi:phosphohistidine phosphatase